jgi:hypothetical protein
MSRPELAVAPRLPRSGSSRWDQFPGNDTSPERLVLPPESAEASQPRIRHPVPIWVSGQQRPPVRVADLHVHECRLSDALCGVRNVIPAQAVVTQSLLSDVMRVEPGGRLVSLCGALSASSTENVNPGFEVPPPLRGSNCQSGDHANRTIPAPRRHRSRAPAKDIQFGNQVAGRVVPNDLDTGRRLGGGPCRVQRRTDTPRRRGPSRVPRRHDLRISRVLARPT